MSANSILFVTPPYHCGVVEVAGRWIPGQFVTLAASARKAGVKPVLYDAMSLMEDHDSIVEKIREVKPDYLGVSAITATIVDSLKILKNAKGVDSDIVTILGGVHPTFSIEELFSKHGSVIDFVVAGEGEETLYELLKALENNNNPPREVNGVAFEENEEIHQTPPRPFIEDINNLENDWDILNWDNYTYFVFPGSTLGAVSTSRGCDADCIFCSQQKFWKQTWRSKTPEVAVEEIALLNEKYGVDVLLLADEYPTKDRDRWEEILDRLIHRDLDLYILMETKVDDIVRDRDIMDKYREAGIIHIYIGVEATNQEVLDFIKKDMNAEMSKQAIEIIHSENIVTETSFLIGFPDETDETIQNTLELSKWYNPDFAHYLALTPWPYTDMYDEMEEHVAVHDYSKYNLIEPVINPPSMTLEGIDEAIVKCYKEFYMDKLGEVVSMENEFKKRYLGVSMKLIMDSSFLIDKLGTLGKMPKKIAEYVQKLNF